ANRSDPIERGRRRLEMFLMDQRPRRQRGTTVAPASLVVPWYRRPSVVSLATAAAVLLAVFVYPRAGPHPDGHSVGAPARRGGGWSRAGARPDQGPANVYLNRRAEVAGEWFNGRPEEPAALAKRIEEFRQGCSVLIFAAHQPLPAADRQWLVEACRGWAGKLD